MHVIRTAAAVAAAAACIAMSGCAGASAEFSDTARQDSAALRVEARSSAAGAAEAQRLRLAELAEALGGGGAAAAQGERLSAYAEAATGVAGEPQSSAAAHQGARLSAYADARGAAAE